MTKTNASCFTISFTWCINIFLAITERLNYKNTKQPHNQNRNALCRRFWPTKHITYRFSLVTQQTKDFCTSQYQKVMTSLKISRAPFEAEEMTSSSFHVATHSPFYCSQYFPPASQCKSIFKPPSCLGIAWPFRKSRLSLLTAIHRQWTTGCLYILMPDTYLALSQWLPVVIQYWLCFFVRNNSFSLTSDTVSNVWCVTISETKSKTYSDVSGYHSASDFDVTIQGQKQLFGKAFTICNLELSCFCLFYFPADPQVRNIFSWLKSVHAVRFF